MLTSLLNLAGLVRVCYRVGVGVGSGDIEVDIIYIPLMFTAQYTGLLGLYKTHIRTSESTTKTSKTSDVTCTVLVRNSNRGALNPFPCE